MNAITKAQPQDIEVQGGLVKCSNAGQMLAYCDTVYRSGLAPSSFKSGEQIFIAVQYGGELGLSPMTALSSIYVVNGRPSLWGTALPGLVLSKGLLEDFKEWVEGAGDNMIARCYVKRRGIGSGYTAEFSWLDAKRAALTGKDIWQKYPADLLKARARARAFKTLFADCLCGLPIKEDIQDVEPDKRPLTGTASIIDPLQEPSDEPKTLDASVSDKQAENNENVNTVQNVGGSRQRLGSVGDKQKKNDVKEGQAVKESENTGLQNVAPDRSAIDRDRERCETIIFTDAKGRIDKKTGKQAGWTLIGLIQSAEGGAIEYKTDDRAILDKAKETKGQKMKVTVDSEGWIKDLEIA